MTRRSTRRGPTDAQRERAVTRGREVIAELEAMLLPEATVNGRKRSKDVELGAALDVQRLNRQRAEALDVGPEASKARALAAALAELVKVAPSLAAELQDLSSTPTKSKPLRVAAKRDLHADVCAAGLSLVVGIQRVVAKVQDRSTPASERASLVESLRALVRAERGIPSPGDKGYARSVALHVETYLEQARSEGYDAAWFKGQCIIIADAFTKVPGAQWSAAIAGLPHARAKRTSGRVPVRKIALAICEQAGIQTTAGNVGDLKHKSSPAKRMKRQ